MTKIINIDILGMTCAACSARVEKALSKNEAIINPVVNLLQQKATIEYNPEKITIEEIVKIVEKTGYEVPLDKRTILVEGMTCAACSTRVDKALNKLDGVVRANVNLSTNKAIIEFPSGTIEDELLIEIIENQDIRQR